GRQESTVAEVVDGRQQLLGGQIAGDAEDDQGAGAGDPGEAAIALEAERIAAGRTRSGHQRSISVDTVSMSEDQEASNFSTPSASSSAMTPGRSMPSSVTVARASRAWS